MRRATSQWFWACFAFVVLVAVVGAWSALVAAPRERERSLGHWRDQLSAMADDRKAALDRWVYERFGDAAILAANADVAALIAGTAGQSGTAAHRQEVRSRLATLLDAVVEHHGYRTALILDLDGRTLVAGGQSLDLEPACFDLTKRVIAGQGPLADFHLHAGTTPLLQFAAPIPGARDAKPIGVVLLVVDPKQWLYPFLRHEAVLSETAETVLVRREGDSALFLTPLRHWPNPPMTFRRSAIQPGFPAHAALVGEETFSEYSSYRGVPVLAATRHLKGAPWGLIVKIDRAEALGEYRQWLALRTIQLGALVLAIGGLVWGLWHRQRSLVRNAIASSEHRLGELVQHANDAVFVLSTDGEVLQANWRAEEMYGYSQDELRRLTLADLCAPETKADSGDAIRRVAQSDGLTAETVHRRRDGSTFPVEASARRAEIRGEWFLFDVVRDITERKRAEGALRQSEERYHGLFDQSPIGIYRTTPDGRILLANPALLRMLGYSSVDELRARNLEESGFGPDHPRQAFRDTVEREGKVRALEGVWTTKNGRHVHVRENAHAIRDATGAILYYEGTVEDITTEREAQEALRESESKYRSLVQQARDAIIVVDRDGDIQLVNKKACESLGYTEEELLKLNIAATCLPEESHRAAERNAAVLRGEHLVFERAIVRKDGTVFLGELSLGRLPSGVTLGFMRDISERKRAEKQLLAERKRLRALASQLAVTEERERRRLAMLLHDRVGQLLALSKIKLSALREEASATSLTHQADQVLSLVEETLQEVRSLTLDLAPPVLYEVGLEAGLEWLGERLKDSAGLAVHVAPSGNPRRLADEIRVLLFTAVRELLVNVAKHAHAGSAEVLLNWRGETLELTVADDGVGFDPGEGGPASLSQPGFGLFSIRERLRDLGGRLEITSAPGKGTSATLVLPLGASGLGGKAT
jgi:PAS domain S-box-containing protein